MKNKSLLLNKNYLPAWIIYHAAVLVFFVITLIVFPGKVGIDSDLFNLVPKSISMASVKKADDKMMAVTSQNIFILVANEDFKEAKRVAEKVYGQLEGSKNFESVSLYSDVGAMSEITDFLYEFTGSLKAAKILNQFLFIAM